MLYTVCHVHFELPPSFVDRTVQYAFDDDLFEPTFLLRIVKEEAPPEEAAESFEFGLRETYDSVEVVHRAESGGRLRVTAEVELQGLPPSRAEFVVLEGSRLSLRAEMPRDTGPATWDAIVASLRAEAADAHGWVGMPPRRYLVGGFSVEVPSGWLDVTDYAFVAQQPPLLDILVRQEEEPEMSPEERVNTLLLQFDAADPSFRLRDEGAFPLDGGAAHRGSWENVERGTALRHDFVAVAAAGSGGAQLLASGPPAAFAVHGPAWEALLRGLRTW